MDLGPKHPATNSPVLPLTIKKKKILSYLMPKQKFTLGIPHINLLLTCGRSKEPTRFSFFSFLNATTCKIFLELYKKNSKGLENLGETSVR